MMKVERLIGGALGLVAFASIVTVSALKGVPFAETVFRALAADFRRDIIIARTLWKC